MHLIWPWQDRRGRFSWLKAGTLALMFAPAIWLIWQVESGTFGRGPLGGMTYWSGVWATAILVLALAVTPAVVLFNWPRVAVVRRMIGVTGLVYTVAHIIIYFALRYWNFSYIANEMVTRLSLIVATVSTVGIVALGVTSFDAAIRRMGAQSWNRLHNWVYVITFLAILHYLLSPSIYSEQYLLTGMFVWLMAWRMLNRRGRGTDLMVLLLLTVLCALFTALFEAFWASARYEFEFSWILSNNFNLLFGLSPAWKILILGLFFTAITGLRRRTSARAAV